MRTKFYITWPQDLSAGIWGGELECEIEIDDDHLDGDKEDRGEFIQHMKEALQGFYEDGETVYTEQEMAEIIRKESELWAPYDKEGEL